MSIDKSNKSRKLIEGYMKKIKFYLSELEKQLGYKPTYKCLEEITGTSASALSNRYFNDGNIKDDEVEKIEQYYNISLSGNTNDDCVLIDYYPGVFGSCGRGAFVLSEQKELIQVPQKFFGHFSKQKHYSVINAIGESMLPTLRPKDKLIVEHWQGEQIKDNQVYVFCYKDEIFVKRLIKNIDEIIVKSDNPDPMYRPRYIEKEDMNNVLIVGEIVGLMRDMR